MNDEPTPLYIQDVIELLTNIKLKHGNLPVYVEHGFTEYWLEQSDQRGIHYVQNPPSVIFSVET
jgi:hypothetical protein